MFLYIKRDQILQRTISEVNKSLNTPVDVKKIDFSLFSNWPNASILLKSVKTLHQEGFNAPFVKAGEIQLSVNLFSVLSNQYTINEITIKDATFSLEINQNKANNFSVFKKGEKKAGKNKKIAIKKISIINSQLTFHDYSKATPLKTAFQIKRLVSSADFKSNFVKLNPVGNLVWENFRARDLLLPKNQAYKIDLNIHYQFTDKNLEIFSGMIKHHDLSINQISGSVNLKGNTSIKLNVGTDQFAIEKLPNLIPAKYIKQMKSYELTGNAKINFSLEGSLDNTLKQKLLLNFDITSLAGKYPDKGIYFSQHQLSGLLSKEKGIKYPKSLLKAVNGKGKIAGSSINYHFEFLKADGKSYSGDLSGTLTGSQLNKIYSSPNIQNLKGQFIYDLHLQTIKNQIASDGEIEIKNASFVTNSLSQPIEKINSSLVFNNGEIAFQDLNWNIGKSDFAFSGVVINPTNIPKKNASFFIDGKLSAKKLLLDEIMGISYNQTDGKENVKNEVKDYTIPPSVNIRLALAIDNLSYKRFKAKELITNVHIKNRRIISEAFNFRSIGGSVNGAFTAFPEKGFIKSIIKGEIKNLESDSIFYVFENFDQDFIENKHLKGQISAKVTSDIYLTKNLTPISSTLVSTIDATIANGRLVNFQPMYRLSTFVDEAQLAELSFSKMKNKITIKDSKILIPEMSIESNVSNIELSGWHTLDQKLEYHLKVPLRKKYKKDRDERFGEIADADKNISNLFLKIKGSTSDYKISYDRKAVLKKVKEDIKQEGKDLIKIFQNKGKKEKDITTLDEDEYFDFDTIESDSIKSNQ